MKRILLIVVAALFTFTTKAQIANLVTLPDFKDGDKLMDILIFDTGLDKQLVVSSSYNSNPNLKGGIFGGATKKWDKFSILNTNDLSETTDLGQWPKADEGFKGCPLKDISYFRGNAFYANYRFPIVNKSIYRIDEKENNSKVEIYLKNIYCPDGKLNQNKLLFEVESKEAMKELQYKEVSKSQGYRIFNYIVEDKNANTRCSKFWIFNYEFNFIKKDSITIPIADGNGIMVKPYENGYMLLESSIDNNKVIIHDLNSKKNHEFNIPKGNRLYKFAIIKKLANSKIMLAGDFIDGQGKNQSYGVCKFIFDTEKNTLEEPIIYNCIPKGKDDKSFKYIYSYQVYENGTCDFLVGQSGGNDVTVKFELVHFDNASTSWKKQLPIPTTNSSSNPRLFAINNTTYITYMVRSGLKVDADYFNNYTYGKPYTPDGSPNPDKLWNDRDLTLLKVSPTGEIAYQVFENRFVDQILLKDNELIVLQKRGSPMGFMHKFFKLQFPK